MLNPWNGKQLIPSNLTVNCMLIWEMTVMALDLAALQQSSGSHGLSNFLKLAY